MQLSRKKQVKARTKHGPRAILWRRIGLGVFVVVCIGLFITAIWYGTRASALTILDIEVIGGETISHDEIIKLVDEELLGTYYRLVPKRFAWTYPERRITDRIAQTDRIKHVLVDRTGGTTLTVVFEEYKPFALWCEDFAVEKCVFLDRDGYAFSDAPHLAGGSFLRYIDPAVAMEVGETVFTPDFIRRTNEFVTTAYDELGFNITTVEKTSEQELKYYIAGGGLLRTSLLETYEDTIENLATILQSEEFKHLEPGNFQYIDLRFGNKVFVNEELAAPEGTASSSAASSSNSL